MNVIDDGHTLTGLIPARHGKHNGIKFTYRRALPRRYRRWVNVDRMKGDADFEADVALICEHVQAFELIEPLNGEAAPSADPKTLAKTLESLSPFEPPDVASMVNHILGVAVTQWDGPEKNEP